MQANLNQFSIIINLEIGFKNNNNLWIYQSMKWVLTLS